MDVARSARGNGEEVLLAIAVLVDGRLKVSKVTRICSRLDHHENRTQ